jgi:uncharacterized membrane protein
VTVRSDGQDGPATGRRQRSLSAFASFRAAGEKRNGDIALVDLLVVLVTLAAVALVSATTHAPARSLLVFLFAGFVPGWVVCRLHPTMPMSSRLPVAVGLSIAIDAIISALQLWTTLWIPFGAFYVLAAASMVFLAIIRYAERRTRELDAKRPPP